MSETQSRPTGSRGRGSYRGGRGGHSYRGGRGAPKTTKNEDDSFASESLEDQGEIGELKKKYASKVPMIKEVFPEWSTEDIVFTLEEANGDEAAAIERITEGTASQWGEVKKKQDRSKSKVKEGPSTTTESATGSVRGRGRGGAESRGRGRGDRGRGRGSRAGIQTNGTRATEKPVKAPTDGWGDTAATNETPAESTWDTTANGEPATSNDWASAEPVKEKDEPAVSKGKATAGAKPGGWAALFAKPPPTKSAPKAAAPQAPAAPEATPQVADETNKEENVAAPVTEDPNVNGDGQTREAPPTEPDINITPSNDELTETNLERLPDVSHPPESATVASTVASTQDPHSQLNSANPLGRPALSGYAATAAKAAGVGVRSASYNRRVLEQQEAVVMPGERAVDRAAVQFGSMGLGGSEDLEAEEDREEPETRAQPPNDSPVAPRASLPPAPVQQQQQLPQQQVNETMTAARPAPGLPPAPQQQQQSPIQPSSYADYSRYGQPPQKAYDPFGQQSAQPQPQSQESFSVPQSQAQPPATSGAGDYSSFYSANQQRDAYSNNYYGNYVQNQEPQQRSGSALGTSAAQETQSQYANRYGQGQQQPQEAPSSGHNTPNPATQTQQQPQPGQPMAQAQNAPGGYPYGGYPSTYGYPQYNQYMQGMQGMHHNQHSHQYGRNRPMFDDARRYEQESGYMGGHGYGYGGQYGGSYGKNMYGQPQHQYSYEHGASPANTSGLGPSSMSARDSGYRTGSAQPSESQQSTSGFGGMSDPFSRSGFGGQQQPLGQQSSSEDASKTGPSPLNQPGRPDSAANISGQQGSQTGGFPPPQSQQGGHQAFGGYPSQYGLSGGLGTHHSGQNHQQAYGSYGGQGFGGYGYGGRNQWGQYAGGHQ